MADTEKKQDKPEEKPAAPPPEPAIESLDIPAKGTDGDPEVAEKQPAKTEAPKPVKSEEKKVEPTPPADDFVVGGLSEETTSFDDDKTNEAINDIAASEGDELLAAQDAAAGKNDAKPKKEGHWLVRWWHNKWARSLTLLLLFGGMFAILAFPTSRYWFLNTIGVRSSASVEVVDGATQMPLKGVQVTIGDQDTLTDADGKAQLEDLKLGPSELVIAKTGFATIKQSKTIGWGSNPLGTFALKAVGVQYVIEVRDFLSEKPVEGVEAVNGVSTAVSDKNGKITLTLPDMATAEEGASLTKAGYRTEKIALPADAKQTTKTSLVLARKAVFANRISGRYDVYKSDIDGKNKEVLLTGTGNETSNMSLVVSPDGNRAALVSTRDGKRDSGGALLNSLVLIDVSNGETLTIAEAPQIQLIDWLGPRLIFMQVSSSNTAANRYTVTAYNYGDNTRLQLAAANKLNAAVTAQGLLYYAVAADAANPSAQVGLFRIGPDGTGRQRMFEQEVTTVLRNTYDSFVLQNVEGDWFTYTIASGQSSPSSLPSSLVDRGYFDNANRSKSLWINQNALMVYDTVAKKDTTVKTESGLTYPAQWLTGTAIIYRIAGGGQTADYALSLEGGSAHKIADVVATFGFAQ